MGASTFASCKRLEEITLPGTILEISDSPTHHINAVMHDESYSIHKTVKSIEILEGLQTIRSSTFSSFSALTSVKLPDSITQIETGAFPKSNELLKVGCTSYARKRAEENGYPADAGQAGYRYLAVHTGETKAKDAVYPTEKKAGLTASVRCAACGDVLSCGVAVPPLSQLSMLKLPEQLQRIREEVFMGCACEGVIVPDGCKVIGPRAFADCKDLLYIRIPKSVTSVAEDAFEGCGDIIIER